jgi:hypothetical protein
VPPLEVVRRFQAAVAAGTHGEDLRVFFTEDATTIEHPNALKPSGAVMALEEMLAGSSAGAKLLHWQRFDVHQVVEHGNEVIIRVTWTGEVAAPAAPSKLGSSCRHSWRSSSEHDRDAFNRSRRTTVSNRWDDDAASTTAMTSARSGQG